MTYSFTWFNKMVTYSYTFLWFLYTLIAVCKQSWQLHITILVSELNIWAKFEHFQTVMSEYWIIHITMTKNWVSHILFLRKRGLIVYLAALKKGPIRAAHPYYVIYRKLPTPTSELWNEQLETVWLWGVTIGITPVLNEEQLCAGFCLITF